MGAEWALKKVGFCRVLYYWDGEEEEKVKNDSDGEEKGRVFGPFWL